jgi:hypothetical protein
VVIKKKERNIMKVKQLIKILEDSKDWKIVRISLTKKSLILLVESELEEIELLEISLKSLISK